MNFYNGSRIPSNVNDLSQWDNIKYFREFEKSIDKVLQFSISLSVMITKLYLYYSIIQIMLLDYFAFKHCSLQISTTLNENNAVLKF